ncbi:oxidoreductase [Meredithblackwellia eburnea MCA 4105]
MVQELQLNLNILDLQHFLDLDPDTAAKDPEVLKTAQLLKKSYEQHGFVYMTGWEKLVTEDMVKGVFDYSEKLFSLPQEKKDACSYTTTAANRGYLAFGRENRATDRKETWEIGNGVTPEFPERWPEEDDIPGFKSAMSHFHLSAHTLNLRIMSLLALALQLPYDFFEPQINQRCNNLRLLHYPAAKRGEEGKGDSRLIPHTDDGTITLLWQDFTGGLEVQAPNGEWVPVVPKPRTLLVNVGDMLERWSNDSLKSTRHRAVIPPLKEGEDGEGLAKVRRSIAYFGNPNSDALIDCIPGTGEPKYKFPILAKEFYSTALSYTIEQDGKVQTKPVEA